MYKTIKPGTQEQGMKCRDAGDGGILYSGKYCQAFRGMSQNIPGECRKTFQGNVLKHSEECRQTFREMFQDSLNLNFDLLCQILLIFYQILLLNCYKTKEKTQSCPPITEQIF